MSACCQLEWTDCQGTNGAHRVVNHRQGFRNYVLRYVVPGVNRRERFRNYALPYVVRGVGLGVIEEFSMHDHKKKKKKKGTKDPNRKRMRAESSCDELESILDEDSTITEGLSNERSGPTGLLKPTRENKVSSVVDPLRKGAGAHTV
jgi:hypothetical protein